MSMTFEDLDCWKKARQLVNTVYALTRDRWLAKDYGLCHQIQRAAVSGMSNVAEGFERQHGAEKMQAYNITRASCGEVRSLLYVIEDNYPAQAQAASAARKLTGEVGALLSGLIASTRNRLIGTVAGGLALLALPAVAGSSLLH